MARIGVMGCGSVSDFGHIPAILHTQGLELTALFDPVLAHVSDLSAKYGGIPAFTDQEKFLESGLDAVVIASPAPFHRENLMACARHKMHVLCEKPIAMKDSDGQEMIRTMNETGRIFAIGLVYRFSPVALQIRSWVREGLIGEVRSLRLIYIWDLHGQYEQNGDGEWIESPRYRGRMIEGGPMVDCGVHQIDLARWWLGSEIVRAEGTGAWVADYEAPDHVYGHFEHFGGAHSMVEMSFSYGHTAREPLPQFSYHLIGTGGVIRYDRDGYVLELRDGQHTLHVPGASEKNFLGMHAAFERAMRTGDMGDLATGDDALIATRLAWDVTEQTMAKRVKPVRSPVSLIK